MTQRQQRADKAAAWLFAAHRRRERFQPLPPELAPRTAEEAYDIQDAYVALRAHELGGIAGYKIALTTRAMQQFVGVDAPQAGAMLERSIRKSPARVRAADYVRLIVEFEIGVQIGEDMPAADAPFTRDRVIQSVAAIMPALELVDDRNADYADLRRHPLELVADNAWNEGAVLGAPVADWREIDLATLRCVAAINGADVGEGRGADALGHPFDAVAWMANHLAALGRGLLRGDVVITGSLVTSKTVSPGDRLRFFLEGHGGVELTIE